MLLYYADLPVIPGKIFACLNIFLTVHVGKMHFHPPPGRFIIAAVVLNVLIIPFTAVMGIFRPVLLLVGSAWFVKVNTLLSPFICLFSWWLTKGICPVSPHIYTLVQQKVMDNHIFSFTLIKKWKCKWEQACHRSAQCMPHFPEQRALLVTFFVLTSWLCLHPFYHLRVSF